MSRKAPDPSARIAQLKLARKALPRLKLRGAVNAEEMAKIAGVTWRSLKPQIEADPEFPCLLRGSEGSPYQFNAKAVLDHMIRRLEEKKKDRSDRNRRIAEMAGLSPELADTGMTLEELRVLDQLQVSAQRRKIEQRNYVPLADFEGILAELFSTMQAETLSTVGRLDPAGKWPAAVREDVREELRSLLVRIHDKVAKRLSPDALTRRGNREGARATRR